MKSLIALLAFVSLSAHAAPGFLTNGQCEGTGDSYSDTEFSQQTADVVAEQSCLPNRGPGQACVDQGCTQDASGQFTCTYEIYDCN